MAMKKIETFSEVKMEKQSYTEKRNKRLSFSMPSRPGIFRDKRFGSYVKEIIDEFW